MCCRSNDFRKYCQATRVAYRLNYGRKWKYDRMETIKGIPILVPKGSTAGV